MTLSSLSSSYRELRRDQATTFASLSPSEEGRALDRSEPLMAMDFFISYASPDAAWAEWVGWVLEDGGASVIIQAWDFAPGTNFVIEMQHAAASARRTIAILSPDYLNSSFAAPEWAAAFAQDPEGMKRSLVPVRVRECALQGMLRTILHINLVGLDEDRAHKQLVDGLSPKRAKPDRRPAFPGEAVATHRASRS